ncbi:unnamed protein product [Caenorhabditis brenneri]
MMGEGTPKPSDRPKKVASRKTTAGKPYHFTKQYAEKSKTPFYGCAFNQFVKFPDAQILATVTTTFLHLYELPIKQKTIIKRDSARIILENRDDFYSVAWCQQPSDIPGIPMTKLVVGGETGRMYVVDYETMTVDRELTGLRGMCNEIRTHPVFPSIIAAASNDRTVQVYDIRCDAPLFICGGRNVHSDKSMSVDWSPNGSHLVDSGYDHKVFLWNFSEPHIVEHLINAIDALDLGEEAPTVEYTDVNEEMAEMILSPKKKALFLTSPEAFAFDVHFDSVDCIRLKMIKGQMYFVSRNCGNSPSLAFWRFGAWDKSQEVVPETDEPNQSVTQLSRKQINGVPIPYFMKFDIDADFQWCVVPGAKGDIQFFALRDREATGPTYTTIVSAEQWIIRQVAFCDRSEFFVAVSDNGIISRYDKNRGQPPIVEEKVKGKRKKETRVKVTVKEEEKRDIELVYETGASSGGRAAEDFDDFVIENDENSDPLIIDLTMDDSDDDIEIVYTGPSTLNKGDKDSKKTAGTPKAPQGSAESARGAPPAPEAPVLAGTSEVAAHNNQMEGVRIKAEPVQGAVSKAGNQNGAEQAEAANPANCGGTSEASQVELQNDTEAGAPEAGNQEDGSSGSLLSINGQEAQKAIERDRPNKAPEDNQTYRDTGDGYQVAYDGPPRYMIPLVPETAPYSPEDYEKRELPDNVSYVRIEEIEEEEEEADEQEEEVLAPHEIPVASEEIVGQEDDPEEEE